MNENKIIFFSESRLGYYFTLDLTYKISLGYTSLLSSILYIKNYEEANAVQEQKNKQEEI